MSFMYKLSQLCLNHPYMRTRYDVEISGAENVPSTGGGIIAANHRSMQDLPLLTIGIDRQIHYVAKQELYKHSGAFGRIFEWYLNAVETIPLDKNSKNISSLKSCISSCRDYLDTGNLVGIFPEGERNQGIRMFPFEKLVEKLSKRCDVPVIPVGIWGSERQDFRSMMYVSVGKPLDWREGMTKKLENTIGCLVAELQVLDDIRSS
ncbi:1-acyl-sn-glycerol-3-phosphate acyltransferase [Candidatus Woesearchaeota archaeon]|nr:1-acyl-sn-glycerol-3-phosphate acyltransferase [Candidatus Woesearchaeota archaeon]